VRICLIHPPQPNSLDDRLDIPLGQLYLAAVLQQSGYDVKIADLSSIESKYWPKLIGWADIYGFTIYSASYYIVKDILKLIKEISPRSKTVAGGAHPSALPEETLNDFDYVIVGEGEYALRDLVIKIEKGLAIESRIIEYPLIENLDDLPFPDLSLIDIHSYNRIVDGSRSISFLTSRGCPNNCAFCCNFMSGKRIRFRSLNNITAEISLIKSKYKIRNFIFYDETLTINKRKVKEMAEKFKALDIRFRASGITKANDSEIFENLYGAGCRNITFGVETGSEELLRKMNKKQSKKDIKKAIKNAKKAGLIVKVFLIVGFPGETYQTVQETIDLMIECRPHQYTVFNFVPFPGCDVWNNPQNYKITYFEKNYRQYFNISGFQEGGLTIETENMTRLDVKNMRNKLLEGLSQLEWQGDVQKYQRELNRVF